MIVDIIKPENENEELLHSRTKISEKLKKQTHRKPHGTLEFTFTEPKETFSNKSSILLGLLSKWMIGLSNLEVYTSFLNSTEENDKLKFYTDLKMSFHYGIKR